MLDNVIYKIFKNRWKLEENFSPSTYTVPKTQKVRFLNNNLVLFRYPSHYRHSPIFEYRSALAGYFYAIGAISFIIALRVFKKTKSKLGTFVISGISLSSFLEGRIASSKIEDVKEITLKDGGKILNVKSFRDQDQKGFDTDVKNIRIVNKHNNDLIVFVNKEDSDQRRFRFYFMEPTAATVYNKEIFDIVIRENKYLKVNKPQPE